jgi:hypothetical protein
MSGRKSMSPIFLSLTDKGVVLAILEDSTLAFVPLEDAQAQKLSYTFKIPPAPKVGSSSSIPLQVAGQGVDGQVNLNTSVSYYDMGGGNGYRLAHVGKGDMVYVNHSRDHNQYIPYGVSLTTGWAPTRVRPTLEVGPDLVALGPRILGTTLGAPLHDDGRLGLSISVLGSNKIKSGTAIGYAFNDNALADVPRMVTDSIGDATDDAKSTYRPSVVPPSYKRKAPKAIQPVVYVDRDTDTDPDIDTDTDSKQSRNETISGTPVGPRRTPFQPVMAFCLIVLPVFIVFSVWWIRP